MPGFHRPTRGDRARVADTLPYAVLYDRSNQFTGEPADAAAAWLEIHDWRGAGLWVYDDGTQAELRMHGARWYRLFADEAAWQAYRDRTGPRTAGQY